ncbi:hypothetical protein B0H11DRAFT_2110893 [Mycena galericulata]|nr:hypothetical protein B0H11DRAFT_2110893 [Mycena galericulata]
MLSNGEMIVPERVTPGFREVRSLRPRRREHDRPKGVVCVHGYIRTREMNRKGGFMWTCFFLLLTESATRERRNVDSHVRGGTVQHGIGLANVVRAACSRLTSVCRIGDTVSMEPCGPNKGLCVSIRASASQRRGARVRIGDSGTSSIVTREEGMSA